MEQRQPPTDFENGVCEYSPGLKAFLTRRLGSEEDAEDALQEILYNLFRTAGDDLAGITNLPAWLYRSARNLIANLGRRHSMESLDEQEMLLDIIAEGSDSQESHMLRQMFWAELETALSQLPPEQRQIWEMTELEGVPVKEIAAVTGISQATLLSRKYYAVKHLRRSLQQLYDDILYK